MRAVRMAWWFGRMTPGAFEANDELCHRPHRGEGRLRHFNKEDGFVSTGTREIAVLELNIPCIRLQHSGRHQLCLLDNRIGGSTERTASDYRATRSIGSASELHLSRVALHITDLVERHTKEFVDELCEHGRVPLPVRVCAAEHCNGTTGIKPDIHAVVEDAAKFDVIADRAPAQLASLFRCCFALCVTLPIRHIDALVE